MLAKQFAGTAAHPESRHDHSGPRRYQARIAAASVERAVLAGAAGTIVRRSSSGRAGLCRLMSFLARADLHANKPREIESGIRDDLPEVGGIRDIADHQFVAGRERRMCLRGVTENLFVPARLGATVDRRRGRPRPPRVRSGAGKNAILQTAVGVDEHVALEIGQIRNGTLASHSAD